MVSRKYKLNHNIRTFQTQQTLESVKPIAELPTSSCISKPSNLAKYDNKLVQQNKDSNNTENIEIFRYVVTLCFRLNFCEININETSTKQSKKNFCFFFFFQIKYIFIFSQSQQRNSKEILITKHIFTVSLKQYVFSA